MYTWQINLVLIDNVFTDCIHYSQGAKAWLILHMLLCSTTMCYEGAPPPWGALQERGPAPTTSYKGIDRYMVVCYELSVVAAAAEARPACPQCWKICNYILPYAAYLK